MTWHYLDENSEPCTFSPGPAVESLPTCSSNTYPSALLSMLPTPGPCSSPDSETGACPGSPSGMMSAPLTGDPGAGTSMLSPGVSRAKTFPPLVKVKESPEHVQGLFLKCSELLMRCGLRLCSRKTVRSFVPRGWPSSSRDLSAWGMWDESGYWELGTSVQTMSESECGSLPSPSASDADRGGRGDLLQALRGNCNSHFKSPMLPSPRANKWGLEDSHGDTAAWEVLAAMLPTPRASANEDRQTKLTPSQLAGKHGLSLRAALNNLPTPTVCGDYNRKGASSRSGNGLATVLNSLPTPTAKLYGSNQGGAAGRTGKVRPSLESLTGGVYPALREWMMGWPIGWTASKPLAMGRFREWLHSHGRCSECQ